MFASLCHIAHISFCMFYWLYWWAFTMASTISQQVVMATLLPAFKLLFTSVLSKLGEFTAGRKVESVELASAHLVHLYHSFFVAICIGTISDTTVTIALVGLDGTIKMIDFCLTVCRKHQVTPSIGHLTTDI